VQLKRTDPLLTLRLRLVFTTLSVTITILRAQALKTNMDLTCQNSGLTIEYLLGQLNTARQEINNLRYFKKFICFNHVYIHIALHISICNYFISNFIILFLLRFIIIYIYIYILIPFLVFIH